MALRKEEFHYDPQGKKLMDKTSKKRITIDINAELDERIQAAATEQNLSVNQYLENVLREIIPVQRDSKPPRKPVSREGVEKLMQFQDQLLQKHGGKPFDSSVEMLREAREEREKELDF